MSASLSAADSVEDLLQAVRVDGHRRILAEALRARPSALEGLWGAIEMLGDARWSGLSPVLGLFADPEGAGQQLYLTLVSAEPIDEAIARVAGFRLAWRQRCGAERTQGIAVAADTQ